MSRRRVKEMLRQEYNRNKNKDFSNDNDGEDEKLFGVVITAL
jgi:hypothetical protein